MTTFIHDFLKQPDGEWYQAELSGKLLPGDIIAKIGPLSVEGACGMTLALGALCPEHRARGANLIKFLRLFTPHVSCSDFCFLGLGKESVEAHLDMCERPVTLEFHIPANRRGENAEDL